MSDEAHQRIMIDDYFDIIVQTKASDLHMQEGQPPKMRLHGDIQKIRDRSHWNSSNIKPRDPVILGLCKQSDLNDAVSAANERLMREGQTPPPPPLPSEAA